MAAASLPHDHGDALKTILQRMPGEGAFATVADSFRHLSDPTRLRIFWILCHSEECVTNLAAAIGMSDPATSHHLRILKKAGLASSRRLGKEVHYTLADTKEARFVHRMIDDAFEMNCPGTGM
ncbi:MAG: winged helix-turn-helix transcriptional regulator [Ruminococcaceae bacterium]|nr:winged helix-turn-helix transcriptional regulator [Oscillospiraceae bacterium]